MRTALALLLAVSAAVPSFADETREKTLPNGLKILVHPMTGAPLVTVVTMYRVGSVHEPVGQTGITHLCEHMLFKGSRKFPAGEANQLAAACGGYVNGYTFDSEITFFHVVPKERLLDFLDRHADAMENATFDPAEFAKEMVVVRSELEGDENNPGWLLGRAVNATAFQVHGLHHPVIGWRADVERITAEQVRAWYRTHFRPNNAVVIVVGDVDADAAVGEVEKRFSGIEPGQVPFEPAPEPPQDGERRFTMRAPASAPALLIAYHNAPTGHPDSFALEVLQEALGKGGRARLYRALVDTGLATSVTVGNWWSRYPTLFVIEATGVAGKDPAEIEAAVDREIARVASEGMPEDEVKRCIRQLVRTRAFSLDSTEKVAGALADFEVFGSWKYAFAFSDGIAQVTPARVQEVARKYLVRENRTVGLLLPGDAGASPDLTKAASAVDRNPKLPAAAAKPARAAKPPVEFTLANGLRVLFWENPSSPTVALRARWPGGSARDGERRGLASLALEMLHEGTRAHGKAAFDELLEARGCTIDHSLGAEYAEITTAGLAEDFDTIAGLFAEFLTQPAWPGEAFPLARDRVVARLAEEQESPESMGQRALRHALFPPGHPRYSESLDRVLASAKALEFDQARAFHESVCRPRSLLLAISGALDEESARRVAEKAFGSWKADGDVPALTFPPPLENPAEKTIVVFLPGKSETFGAIAVPCPLRRTDPDAPAFDVLNFILGGGEVWTTRLGRKLRVENGLVYGTSSAVTRTLGNGYFWAEFGSNPANADKAMALLKEEIRKIHDGGVTEAEVKAAISYQLGAWPRWTETSEDKAWTVLDIAWSGLGLDWIARRSAAYQAVSKENVDAAARKYLDPDRFIEVIAGTYEKK